MPSNKIPNITNNTTYAKRNFSETQDL